MRGWAAYTESGIPQRHVRLPQSSTLEANLHRQITSDPMLSVASNLSAYSQILERVCFLFFCLGVHPQCHRPVIDERHLHVSTENASFYGCCSGGLKLL